MAVAVLSPRSEFQLGIRLKVFALEGHAMLDSNATAEFFHAFQVAIRDDKK
jgi:hypothetical protein